MKDFSNELGGEIEESEMFETKTNDASVEKKNGIAVSMATNYQLVAKKREKIAGKGGEGVLKI